MSTDKQEIGRLAERYLAGEEFAFDALFEETRNELYGRARVYTEDDGIIGEALSEAYLLAFQNAKQLKDPEDFLPDLWQRLDTALFARIRKDNEEADYPEGWWPEEYADDPAPEVKVFVPEGDNRKIRDAVLRLTPPDRQTAFLYYRDGRSVKETAALLGISEGTVKSRLNGIRHAIRGSLDGVRELPYQVISDALTGYTAADTMPGSVGRPLYDTLKNALIPEIPETEEKEVSAEDPKDKAIGRKLIAGGIALILLGSIGMFLSRPGKSEPVKEASTGIVAEIERISDDLREPEKARAAYSDYFGNLLYGYHAPDNGEDSAVYAVAIDLNEDRLPEFIFYHLPNSSYVPTDPQDPEGNYKNEGILCTYAGGTVVERQGGFEQDYVGGKAYYISEDKELYEMAFPANDKGDRAVCWILSKLTHGKDGLLVEEIARGDLDEKQDLSASDKALNKYCGKNCRSVFQYGNPDADKPLTMYSDAYTESADNFRMYLASYGINAVRPGDYGTDWQSAYRSFLTDKTNSDTSLIRLASGRGYEEGGYRVACTDMNKDGIPEVAMEVRAPFSGGHFLCMFGYGRGRVCYFYEIGFMEGQCGVFRYDKEHNSIHYFAGHGSDSSYYETGEYTAGGQGLVMLHRRVVSADFSKDPVESTLYEDNHRYTKELDPDTDWKDYEKQMDQWEELDWRGYQDLSDVVEYVLSWTPGEEEKK